MGGVGRGLLPLLPPSSPFRFLLPSLSRSPTTQSHAHLVKSTHLQAKGLRRAFLVTIEFRSDLPTNSQSIRTRKHISKALHQASMECVLFPRGGGHGCVLLIPAKSYTCSNSLNPCLSLAQSLGPSRCKYYPGMRWASDMLCQRAVLCVRVQCLSHS